MSDQFSLSPSSCAEVTDPALRQEIHAHTGNDDATSGILRSIDRFGGDDSIVRFEISRKANKRAYRHGSPAAWSVRAVRQ